MLPGMDAEENEAGTLARLTPMEVELAYRLVLGRRPESLEVVALHCRQHDSVEALARNLRISAEYEAVHGTWPWHNIFQGYGDEHADLVRGMVPQVPGSDAGEAGFITDFLGCRTRVTYVPNTAGMSGHVHGYPIPQDWHAEAIEWIGLAKSVLTASGRYRIMEVGAGWAPWLVAGGTLARRRGIEDVVLHGVEADPRRLEFARTHLRDNGFPPEQHHLHQAAAGTAAGTARWPHTSGLPGDFGARPVGPSGVDYRGFSFEQTRLVPILPMAALVEGEAVWDLIHMDVQGTEAELCASCMPLLTERVRWLVVGTHSRKQDGDVMELFWRAGWVLEHEKPTQMKFSESEPSLEGMGWQDGCQVWRNKRLVAASPRL